MPNEFFTVQTLGSFAGATGATVVIANTYQQLLKGNPKWVAFVTAQVVVLGTAYFLKVEPAGYLLGFLNGCLVFLSAAGGSEIISNNNAGDPELQGANGKSRRNWRTSWFDRKF